MKLAKLVLAGSSLMLFSSVAVAQQPKIGMITTINRIDGTVAIAQIPSGTVGDSSGPAIEQFNAQGSLLDNVHVGDKVTYSVTENNGARTITRLDRQK